MTRAHVDAADGHKSRWSLCGPRQDAGSRSLASAGARRQREVVRIKKR